MADNQIDVDVRLKIDEVQKSLNQLKSGFDRFERNANKSFSSATGAFETFKGVVGAQAFIGTLKTVGGAIADAFGKSVESAANLETITTQFEVLTGSAQEARVLIEDLQSFTASTPFQFEGVSKAAATLKSFGFETESILPKLQALGDVAAGSGSSLQEISLIFGQVSAAGKLTGERLLQLQERGIPILDQLAKDLDKPKSAIQKLVSEGKVSFADFEKSFESLSKAGGPFFEGTIKQSKTLQGVISTLKDNIEIAFQGIGQAILPVVKVIGIEFITALQKMQVFLKENQGTIRDFLTNAVLKLLEGLRLVGEFIGPVVRGFQVFGNIISSGVNASLGILASTLGVILEGLAALPLGDVSEGAKGAAQALKEFGEARFDQVAIDAQQIGESFTNNKTAIDEFGNALVGFSDTASAAVIKNTQELNNNTTAVNQNKAAKKAAIEELSAMEAAKREADKEFALEEADRKLAEQQIKDDQELQRISSVLGNEEAIRQQAEINRLNRQGKFLEAKRKRRDLDEKAEKDSIWRVEKYEDLSQKQRMANLKSTLGTIATLQSSSSKELFAIGKAAGIATATIDGIGAVQKALSSAPPPFNFALAALVGVATAANIAKIASAKPPGRQQGGFVPGQGAASAGDNNLIRVNAGEFVANNQQQRNIIEALANGGAAGNNLSQEIALLRDQLAQQPVIVSIDGKEVARATRNAQRNGFALA